MIAKASYDFSIFTAFASVRFAGELSDADRDCLEIPPAHLASACLHPPTAAAGSALRKAYYGDHIITFAWAKS